MTLPVPPPAGSSLTDAQIAQAVPLLVAGTTVRVLAAAIGCSRHLAAVLINAHKGKPPKPRAPKPPIAPTAPTPELERIGAAPAAIVPRDPEEYDDLRETRQKLKGQLDRAIRRGDRAATSAFSLALNRLEKAEDPNAGGSASDETLQWSLLPDGAREFIRLALKTITPVDFGGGLNSEDKLAAAFFFAGFEALTEMYRRSRDPGVRGRGVSDDDRAHQASDRGRARSRERSNSWLRCYS